MTVFRMKSASAGKGTKENEFKSSLLIRNVRARTIPFSFALANATDDSSKQSHSFFHLMHIPF